MNQLNQGESSSALSIHPLKRRRGRPRKDPSLKRSTAAHAPPGFDVRAEQYLPQRADRTNGNESMVGQAVSGVVEATFDAGFLLNVRIGNSPTNFRGIVFKPGHYVPVTAENDVAPHLQMIKRNDVHAPAAENWARREKLAIVTPKRKYKPRKPASSVPPMGLSSVTPMGGRGNVVPVVLQPVNFPNGLPISSQTPSGGPQSGHLLAFGDKDVHMVEPLSMLAPDRSIPAGQIFLGTPHHTSHRVEQNENGPVNGGTPEIGQAEKVKPIESTDIENPGSSETSDLQTENGKEELKFSAEDSGIVSTQETGNTNEPFSTESLPTESVAKPFFNYGTGRMTELLQALQENMKENQVQFSEQPTSGSKGELRGTMTTENDPKNEASVQ
ncbi:hypothetical protein DH2020_033354 [Rehmannia glutinosa]|uniref:Uncharacterized protein n=1 Tax=Rehmannia glutinosa TaxID=99300 RepID=A0ABR0VED6_REHGL